MIVEDDTESCSDNTSPGNDPKQRTKTAGVVDRPSQGSGCGGYGLIYKSAIRRNDKNGAQSVTGTTSALIDSVKVQDIGRHEPYSELQYPDVIKIKIDVKSIEIRDLSETFPIRKMF